VSRPWTYYLGSSDSSADCVILFAGSRATIGSNPSPTEGNSSHRSLYRASSLAPTEVDLSTATSNLNTPFLGDGSPTPRAEPSRHRRRNSREAGPLDYLYDDPRTPYFECRTRSQVNEGRHGWLHPLPGSSTSTSVLYQHQRENRANTSRTAGLGFGESGSLGELPTHSSREGDRDSPAQVQLQHQNHRASTYSLNDPVPYQPSSNSTRYSSSSSPHFPNSTSTSISPATGPVQHPHIQPQLQSQAMRRSEPDRFVKALITARPQPHLTSSFSTTNASPGSPLQQSQSQSQLQLQMGSGQGKRLGRTTGSAGSLAQGGNGGGSGGAGNGSGSGACGAGGKGIGLKTMARGPDGQVVVAGNEGQSA
jgi:hypothetical protein